MLTQIVEILVMLGAVLFVLGFLFGLASFIWVVALFLRGIYLPGQNWDRGFSYRAIHTGFVALSILWLGAAAYLTAELFLYGTLHGIHNLTPKLVLSGVISAGNFLLLRGMKRNAEAQQKDRSLFISGLWAVLSRAMFALLLAAWVLLSYLLFFESEQTIQVKYLVFSYFAVGLVFLGLLLLVNSHWVNFRIFNRVSSSRTSLADNIDPDADLYPKQ